MWFKEELGGRGNMKLIAEDCVKVDDKLYLFCRDYNLFYSINLLDGELVLEGGLPYIKFMCKQLCRKMLYWNGYLIFVPYNAALIYMYHVFDREWQELSFEKDQFGRTDWLFFQAILQNNILFIFGGKYSKIIKINLETKEIEYFEVFQDVYKNIKDKDDVFLRGGYVKQNGAYLFPLAISNHILQIDLSTLAYQLYRVGNETDLYSGIAWDGQSFWLSPRRVGDIIRWDDEKGVERYKLPEIYEDDNIYFSGIYIDKDEIFLPALHSDKSVRMDIKKGSLNVEKRSYAFVKNNDGYNCKFMLNGTLFFEEGSFKKQFACEITDVILARYFNDNSVKVSADVDKGIVREDDNISLAIFCQSIVNR